MGFAEQSNSGLRSNRALDDRRHKRMGRVRETSRKITKTNKPLKSSKNSTSKQELAAFRNEMKEERRRYDMLRVLTLMISIVLLIAIARLIIYLINI